MINGLLARARASLAGARRPKAAFLRRSVSDAYYALFHALALMCANQLIGVTASDSEAWRRTYRALDHGKAKQEFLRKDLQRRDPAVQRIAFAFIDLQEARHNADYDPISPLRRRSDVEPLIQTAEAAIGDISALHPDLARELAAVLIIKARN